MAAPTTSNEFLDLVRKSELLPPPRLEAFLRQIEATPTKVPPRDLASLLVTGGFVTQFQAEQFLQGKWKGFTIGKYRVLERIGAGGMGTVYLCEHVVVGRKVAVKVLPSSQSSNPTAKARFYREARAAGVATHPNLVKAHDVDEENGVHFLVMDYVDGSSLQAIVARFGPLPIARAANYAYQAALGLQAAADAGLVHRDVKPANIMLERNGTIRVLDLGLARFFQDTSDPLTLKYDENTVLGTADYVAPEQAVDSHEVDIRADIYSLGATFYFLLTGQTTYPTGRIAQKLIWLQVKLPTPVRQLRPEVPAGLAAVVEKMMAKKAEDRYPTPAAVAAALAPWANKPIEPPAEQEMPKLSPAAIAAGNGSGSGSGEHMSSPRHPQPRNKASAPQVKRPMPLLALDRGTSSPDIATPLAMSALSPTTVEPPRPKIAMAPSRLPNQQGTKSKLGREVEQHLAPPESSTAKWVSWVLRAGLLILISGGVGVAVSLLTRQP
jgi:eukaryotic-like serine/threonine-protein kinase